HAVTEQKPVIEYRNPGILRRRDYAIDVDTGRHNSRARSQSSRCFSVFAVRRGTSIGGNRPKLMFMGAQWFCGVATSPHSAPMAVSAGRTIGDSPRSVRAALIPATRPDATFSI